MRIRQFKVGRVDSLYFEELSEKELNHFKEVDEVFLFLFVEEHVFGHLLKDFVDGLVLAGLVGGALAADFEELEHFLLCNDLIVWVEFHFIEHACLRAITGNFLNDFFAFNLLKKRPNNEIIIKGFKVIGSGQKVIEHLNAQMLIRKVIE